MNEILTRLGVSAEIQALFNIQQELRFDYGDSFEHFYEGGHLVPTTQNLWRAGNELAALLIIAPSAMELISFMSLNVRKFPDRENLLFIAMGNNCNTAKLQWIRSRYKKRKFILVYGNDLVGRLSDIKIATGLRGKSTMLSWSESFVFCSIGNRNFKLEQDQISLAAFERQAGIRTLIRTAKPFPHNTYLEQLMYNGNK
ncbi:MAG: hypothetical protein JWQ66_2070 [Mucilaginibacter sp.]|nr:hypothetical protein [Mucilaginibacter sp.]